MPPEPGAEQPEPKAEKPKDEAAADAADKKAVPKKEGVLSEEEFAELEKKRLERLEHRKTQSAYNGSTGLLRTHFAGSGPVGTFRVGVLGSWLTTERFLCPQCVIIDGGDPTLPDEVTRMAYSAQFSATLYDFLEAYGAIVSTATSNTRNEPTLLQVLGDGTLGIKAFMPREPDSIFSAGGALELGLLNGAGSVGLDQSNFIVRGLLTLDLTNQTKPDDRIPLRMNLNLNYVFDNSGALVQDVEQVRHQRINRLERFGLNVNRLDRFVPALGIEGAFEVVRPYVEWSIDVPNNRQDYLCSEPDVQAGDTCLKTSPSFAAVPSRATLGVRANVLLDGLSLHAALDLATGGNKPPFWEEVQPEAPWNLFFGASYAADTEPRIERVAVASEVEEAPKPLPPPPPRYAIAGIVVEEGTEKPVPGAILRYQGRSATGMVADDQGNFQSADLEPGTYTFQVTAQDYQEGSCEAVIATAPEGGAGADASASATAAAAPATPADPLAPEGAAVSTDPAAAEKDKAAEAVHVTRIRCALKAKPKLGSVVITVLDAATQAPIAGATVTPSTEDGRSISLESNEEGATRFNNVPVGTLKVAVQITGYYKATKPVKVQPNQEQSATISVVKAGKPTITIGGKSGLTFKKPIRFKPGSAELLPESQGVVYELAALLAEHPELSIEVQSHTDDALPFQSALSLTTDRANAIREIVIANGVPATRISAVGVGGASPLVPNANDKAREKNNRVDVSVKGGTP